jgi:hypothetical protein
MAVALTAAPEAARQAITLDKDDITIRGCVMQEGPSSPDGHTLAWSRKDIMLAAAELPPAAAASRVFYWIDDDTLAEHVGQQIEIKGKLDDFETGKIKIDRDGEFTEITLDLDDDDQKIRVPNSWLSPAAPGQDRKFEIAARRMKVKDLHVLGACGR